jgi:hypothetical protein
LVIPGKDGGLKLVELVSNKIDISKEDEVVNRPEVKPKQESPARRKWYIDTDTGELKPEVDPETAAESQPKVVRAARYVSD